MRIMQKNHNKTIILILLVFSVTLSSPSKVEAVQLYTPQIQVEDPIHMQPKRIRKLPSRGITTNTHEDINVYIKDICHTYNMDPELVRSIIYHESRYNPKAKNGNCVGLMQISTRWHSKRAEKLGVKNLYDPYGNILVGVDYLSELLDRYEDPALVLMLYNMKHTTAMNMYKQGKISKYARSILTMTKEFKKGV